jgi:hypothetical protein
MTVGYVNLTVFSSALLCFGMICPVPSHALPQKPWYVAAFDRVLRVVHNEADALTAVDKDVAKVAVQPYVSRIVKDEGSITIKGQVPSDNDLKFLKGVAEATSPRTTFYDKSRVDAAVPDYNNWLAAMTFALGQLGKLESGEAYLSNKSIVIEGVTKSGDDFATVQKKLRDEAPKSLDIKAAVKPHDVHPFVWFAQLQPGSLNLSGHVPDKQDKVVSGYAESLFQNHKVTSAMEFAEGQPRDWIIATKAALDMLSLLSAGNVEVSDKVVKLEGIYASPAMAAVMKTYSERLPKDFKLETNVLEPVSRSPAAGAEAVNLAAQASSASLNP